MMQGSSRGNVRPFEVMEALREAELLEAQGRHIVHFSLGQPGMSAPKIVLDAVQQKLAAGTGLGYTDARGLLTLRARIAQFYQDKYTVNVPVERIFITVGSSAASFLAMLAACDAGDRIAISRPYYPAYPNMMQALNLVPTYIDTDESTQFQPTWEQVFALHQKMPLKGLLVASPSNPAGTVILRESMKELIAGCAEHGICLFSDEIYHGMTFDGVRGVSALEFGDDAVVLNSFSKYYLLAGWRLGWAVMPEKLSRRYESLLQSFFVSPPAPSQYAALEVFNHLDALDDVVAQYQQNRDVLLDILRRAGFNKLIVPQGAFYIYTNVAQYGMDSREFCHRLLHEAGVSAVAGYDFDDVHGGDYVRLSYSGSLADVREGGTRIVAWLANMHQHSAPDALFIAV